MSLCNENKWKEVNKMLIVNHKDRTHKIGYHSQLRLGNQVHYISIFAENTVQSKTKTTRRCPIGGEEPGQSLDFCAESHMLHHLRDPNRPL